MKIIIFNLLILHLFNPIAYAKSNDLNSLKSPYNEFLKLRGDLHIHSKTASFDAKKCYGNCETLGAKQQLDAAMEAGLDFAAITEHLRDPNTPKILKSDLQWNKVISAVKSFKNSPLIAFYGYEWTMTNKYCYDLKPSQPDFGHKVIILPPTTTQTCLADECQTPDSLSDFMAKVGAIGITAHPWRVKIPKSENLPLFLRRDYFSYTGNGNGDNWIGAEVGPDFAPLIGSKWESHLICDYPKKISDTQTVILPEWKEALGNGKYLAAISSSDRHFSFVPFGQRTTIIFSKERTHKAIFSALKARRTIAALLEPFEIEFYSGKKIIGDQIKVGEILTITLKALPGEVKQMRLLSPNKTLKTWDGDNSIGTFDVFTEKMDLGPLFIEVVGLKRNKILNQHRTTITSPIWLTQD